MTTTASSFAGITDQLRSTNAPPNANRSRTWSEHQIMIYRTELYVLGFTFVIALIGNISVLITLGCKSKKRTRMNLFILHLAVADLAAACFQVLPEWWIRAGRGFHSTDATCKFVKFFQVVSMFATTYVLLCAAFDRYMAIRHPMQSFKTSKRNLYMHIAFSWLISLLMAIPQLLLFEKPENGRGCRMKRQILPSFIKGYVTWYFFALLVVPTLLLAYFYGMIAKVIVCNLRAKKSVLSNNLPLVDRHNKERESSTPRASSTAMISRAKLKTVKMTLVIVCTYVACWSPFFTVQMLSVWGAIDPNNLVSSVLHLLACLNSCTNPWIYMAFSGKLTYDMASCKRKLNCGDKGEEKNNATFKDHVSQTNLQCSTMITQSESFNRKNSEGARVLKTKGEIFEANDHIVEERKNGEAEERI